MTQTVNGMVFDDPYEMNYEVLSLLELSVHNNGIVYDDVDGKMIFFNDQMLKATIDPSNIIYAGQGEVLMDLINNIKITTNIFGYYLTKRQNEGMPFISYFQEDMEDTKTGIRYAAATIKYDSTHFQTSKYYHNRCLKLVDLMFLMDGDPVDLHNFDTFDDIDVKKSKSKRS